jgi:muramoyltetrapeptide carboxypeptidase
MLTQLRLAGVFDQISGLILGHYTDCNPSESKKDCQTVEEVLDDFVKDIKVPVIRHYPFGHSYPFLSLPIGAYVYLDVCKNMVWWDQTTIFK